MRSSIAIASLCAALAVASPLHKKGMVVETDYDVVTDVYMYTVTAEPVTVTAASVPVAAVSTPQAPPPPHRHSHSHPPPAPSSSSAPVVVITTTVAAPSTTPQASTSYVAPTTTAEAAKVVVSSTSVAVAAAAIASSVTDPLSPSAVSGHNNARASHSASAMTWNETLATYAATEASCETFAHNLAAGGGGYGQNIAVAGSTSADAYTLETALANAISEWYAEESLYGSLYGSASPSEAVGDFLHFTQMVWVKSTSVGCAVKTCPTGNGIFPTMNVWYTVCNYYPQGNVLGEFAANVLS